MLRTQRPKRRRPYENARPSREPVENVSDVITAVAILGITLAPSRVAEGLQKGHIRGRIGGQRS